MVEEGFSLKKALFGKISRKLSLVFAVLIFLIIAMSIVTILLQQADFENRLLESIERSREGFSILEEGDVRTLSAALGIFTQNQEFKEIYLEKDREKMYEFGQPLFRQLKEKDGITHFYFIQPDGHNFVRLHNKEVYGDLITRITFRNAKETGREASGIELGKTAFALRVVNPYYDGGELIGYVEFGQEIDHFLDALKKEHKSEFYIVVEKQYLDDAKWSSVREVAGLRNNWNDFEKHVVISSTLEDEGSRKDCFTLENVKAAQKETRFFELSSEQNRFFSCGGFPLRDASGKAVGTVFSVIDVTEEIRDSQTNAAILLGIVAIGIVVVALSGIFFSRSITKPIAKLHKATEEIEKGNFKASVEIKTGDELETLGAAFNKTTEVLAKMDEEHKQLEHAKTEFLSITSHELRSPMTPMKAQLQMLKEGYFGKLNAKQLEALDIVLRNTSRLDNIILDFLEISRIEAARLKFRFVKASLNDYVKRLVEEMAGFMPEKKIEIVARVGKLPVIEVDPDRTMQVLRNLVNNAKKFSPENSKIFVEAKFEGKELLFSVKDQGIGISKENQQRIFEPFFQAEQTMYREKGGTGLGLAICKGIVESQGGRLWIESQEGKGAAFFFTVPLKPVRKIKPIKLLFSPKEDIEKKLEALFVEVLGPMGDSEFNIIKEKGLDYDSVRGYFQNLAKEGVIGAESLGRSKGVLKELFGVGGKKEI